MNIFLLFTIPSWYLKILDFTMFFRWILYLRKKYYWKTRPCINTQFCCFFAKFSVYFSQYIRVDVLNHSEISDRRDPFFSKNLNPRRHFSWGVTWSLSLLWNTTKFEKTQRKSHPEILDRRDPFFSRNVNPRRHFS